MQRWEYLTLVFGGYGNWSDSLGRSGNLPAIDKPLGHPTSLMNELGEQGWELSGVNPGSTNRWMLFFKRPRP